MSKYKPKYEDWTYEDYENSDLRAIEPMTAHALEDLDEQLEKLGDENYVVEEKFDGTRATLHFKDYGCRVFSRRISKKTNWYTENTDSLPQMRDLVIPELSGTIIDGEMFIPHRPFKDVSAIMNCKWDKAIERQKEIGDVVLHSFDILYYKGINIKKLSLRRRKRFLKKVFDVLKKHGVKCIVEVKYFQCGKPFDLEIVEPYDTWWQHFDNAYDYYLDIVRRGGEGCIVKNLDMPYEHKRSKAFLKIKKFYTRECILTGFTEPTKYYDGKFPDDYWEYWEKPDGSKTVSEFKASAKNYIKRGYKPLTKFYFYNWVGNMIFGVIITPDEINNLPSGKTFDFEYMSIDGEQKAILLVGECSGFDDTLREKLSSKFSREKAIGSVIEVKCNEIFKDTGKLRHPRFLRFREDKNPEECTYINHITE